MIHYVTAAQLTNLGRFTIVSKTPSECSGDELSAFSDLVAEGGEVSKSGMEERVSQARVLGFAYEGEALVGVSALKRPARSYRASVSQKSGVDLPESEFPYEIGWLYVKPEYRNAGSGNMLRYLLVQPALGISDGVFATVRDENVMPQRLLARFGFDKAGNVWTSPVTGNRIGLWTRDSSKGAINTVLSSVEDDPVYEMIHVSEVLASILSEDRAMKKAALVPSIIRTASLAAQAGYAQASADLRIAVATEDADLAAHALNFLHTEAEADLSALDPQKKIIGDVVPAESVGLVGGDDSDLVGKVGMLFELATSLPDARSELGHVQIGVEPSIPQVCCDHMAGLDCPHIKDVECAVQQHEMGLSLGKTRETLTQLDSVLRGKLAEAEGAESERIQRLIINLETLMAELFKTGVALASEYVPFGDAIRKASGVRVVGMRPLPNKAGTWELLIHYNDGTHLKSIASNKRSLGLCLGMLKPGTKINFQGTMGSTTADGALLNDGRTLSFDKAPANAPAVVTAEEEFDEPSADEWRAQMGASWADAVGKVNAAADKWHEIATSPEGQSVGPSVLDAAISGIPAVFKLGRSALRKYNVKGNDVHSLHALKTLAPKAYVVPLNNNSTEFDAKLHEVAEQYLKALQDLRDNLFHNESSSFHPHRVRLSELTAELESILGREGIYIAPRSSLGSRYYTVTDHEGVPLSEDATRHQAQRLSTLFRDRGISFSADTEQRTGRTILVPKVEHFMSMAATGEKPELANAQPTDLSVALDKLDGIRKARISASYPGDRRGFERSPEVAALRAANAYGKVDLAKEPVTPSVTGLTSPAANFVERYYEQYRIVWDMTKALGSSDVIAGMSIAVASSDDTQASSSLFPKYEDLKPSGPWRTLSSEWVPISGTLSLNLEKYPSSPWCLNVKDEEYVTPHRLCVVGNKQCLLDTASISNDNSFVEAPSAKLCGFNSSKEAYEAYVKIASAIVKNKSLSGYSYFDVYKEYLESANPQRVIYEKIQGLHATIRAGLGGDRGRFRSDALRAKFGSSAIVATDSMTLHFIRRLNHDVVSFIIYVVANNKDFAVITVLEPDLSLFIHVEGNNPGPGRYVQDLDGNGMSFVADKKLDTSVSYRSNSDVVEKGIVPILTDASTVRRIYELISAQLNRTMR